MGNPFGKIIQNGVEYDVSPYSHVITAVGDGVKTVSTLLGAIRTELFANDFNPNTDMTHATIIIEEDTNRILNLARKSTTRVELSSCSCSASQMTMRQVELTKTGTCYYIQTDVTTGGANGTSIGSRVVDAGKTIKLYYN